MPTNAHAQHARRGGCQPAPNFAGQSKESAVRSRTELATCNGVLAWTCTQAMQISRSIRKAEWGL